MRIISRFALEQQERKPRRAVARAGSGRVAIEFQQFAGQLENLVDCYAIDAQIGASTPVTFSWQGLTFHPKIVSWRSRTMLILGNAGWPT